MYVTSLPVNYPLKNTSIAPALYMFGESVSVMQFMYRMCFPANSHKIRKNETYCRYYYIYVVPPQSWGDHSDTKHSKCLLLGGQRLNQLTLIPKPKGSGGARAATAQVGPANKRNDTKRCLPVEASLRPGEAVPW